MENYQFCAKKKRKKKKKKENKRKRKKKERKKERKGWWRTWVHHAGVDCRYSDRPEPSPPKAHSSALQTKDVRDRLRVWHLAFNNRID